MRAEVIPEIPHQIVLHHLHLANVGAGEHLDEDSDVLLHYLSVQMDALESG